MADKPVLPVTRPHLPELRDFLPYLEQIWANGILTNGGPMHQQLEQALCEYLGVRYVSLFDNGTTALVVALRALDLEGEIITTPYSFIATSHAIAWNHMTPVFADIGKDSFNICPDAIEQCITPRTRAILAVHCYGHPCDVQALEEIAARHNLRVIYDAAHAFAVGDDQGSILRHGDLSVLSFHATKVFSTFEGGAIISHDADTKLRIDRMKNFGIVSETEVDSLGVNGKMSEVHAAMGLLQLKSVAAMIERRRAVDSAYREGLANIAGISIPALPANTRHNYSYFPVRITPACSLDRDALYEALKREQIHTRRYFYPLITDTGPYQSATHRTVDNARRLSEEVLCLPCYPDLASGDQQRVIDAIRRLA